MARVVGTGFGLKHGALVTDFQTEAAQQGFQYMVGGDAQPALAQLQAHMPITEVVTGAAELFPVAVSYTHLTLPTICSV